MNALAIMMMVVALVVLWGGLAAAIVGLSRYDKRTGEDDFKQFEDHTL